MRGHLAAQVGRQGFEQQLAAQRGQALAEAAGVIVRLDGQGTLAEGGAGIHAGIHAHDGDAGFGVAVQQGGLDGGRAAPAGQQRGVHVHTAETRQLQHRRAQDLAESGDNDHIGRPGLKLRHGLGLAQALRLDEGQAQLQRQALDRRRGQDAPAPGRAVGLGDHANDRVNLCQRPHGGDGEVGRTHEDDFGGHNLLATSFSQSSSLTRVTTRKDSA